MRRLLSYEENDPVAFSCILFALTDGVVTSCDAICLRKVGHQYLAEVPYSCGSTQDEPETMPTDLIRAIISGLPAMGREHISFPSGHSRGQRISEMEAS
jgi:hypothetical protein